MEGQKEHTHDVVGTPGCHWGWPAMEEVARAQPLVIALLAPSEVSNNLEMEHYATHRQCVYINI